MRHLRASWRDCYFWGTHQGAELDLLVTHKQRRLGFEFKHTSAPSVTRSMNIALEDLHLDRIDVLHLGKETYPLAKKIRAVAFGHVMEDVEPLR